MEIFMRIYKSKINELVGSKIGKWFIDSRISTTGPDRGKLWCTCECGFSKKVLARDLLNGSSKGCRSCIPKFGKYSPLFKGHGEISKTTLEIIKQNAKLRNIKYSISDDYLWKLFLSQNRKCALSGLDIDFGIHNINGTKEQNRTASLDRINNNLGYEEGNLQWVHKDINMMKKHYTQEYFILLCSLVSKNADSSNQ